MTIATAKLAALLPFGKVTDFLSELLPLSAKVTASTVRNRTLKVGKRLEKSADELAAPSHQPCPETVVGLDGAYVRSRHPHPERNFEVIVGKVMDQTGRTTRLAAVREGGPETIEATRRALRQHGVEETTTVTMFTDGDTGLRAIQRHVAPQAEHVLDWFPIAMRFENLKQVAKGITGLTEGGIRRHALDQLDRVKWRFWHGQVERGLMGLVHLRQWAQAKCFAHMPTMEKLGKALFDTIRYLETNADSLPNYGQRHRKNGGSPPGLPNPPSTRSCPGACSRSSRCAGAGTQCSSFSMCAFTSSTTRWRTRSVTGIKAFGLRENRYS